MKPYPSFDPWLRERRISPELIDWAFATAVSPETVSAETVSREAVSRETASREAASREADEISGAPGGAGAAPKAGAGTPPARTKARRSGGCRWLSGGTHRSQPSYYSWVQPGGYRT